MFLRLLLRHFIPPEIVLRIGPTPSSSYLSFCLWLIVSRVSAEVASICNTSSTQLRSPSICEKSAFGTSASNIISGQNPASWEMGRMREGIVNTMMSDGKAKMLASFQADRFR